VRTGKRKPRRRCAHYSPGERGKTKPLGAALALKAAGTALHHRPEAFDDRTHLTLTQINLAYPPRPPAGRPRRRCGCGGRYVLDQLVHQLRAALIPASASSGRPSTALTSPGPQHGPESAPRPTSHCAVSCLGAPHRGTLLRHNPRLNRIDNGHVRRPRVLVYMQTGHTRPMNTIGLRPSFAISCVSGDPQLPA
jgi:hypothetical protein